MAIGASALATAAAATTREFRLARHDVAGAAVALAGLEALRAGPRVDGVDTTIDADGTAFVRWTTARDGRGRPSPLQASVAWPGHGHALATEVLP